MLIVNVASPGVLFVAVSDIIATICAVCSSFMVPVSVLKSTKEPEVVDQLLESSNIDGIS